MPWSSSTTSTLGPGPSGGTVPVMAPTVGAARRWYRQVSRGRSAYRPVGSAYRPVGSAHWPLTFRDVVPSPVPPFHSSLPAPNCTRLRLVDNGRYQEVTTAR